MNFLNILKILYLRKDKNLNTLSSYKSTTSDGVSQMTKLSESRQCLDIVLNSIEGSKAESIISIDIRRRSALADYMVIASGRSQRHVAAIADYLMRALKEAGYRVAHIEGLESGEWVLIDAGDIIIHLFRPETRDYYNLEKMWQTPVSDDEVEQMRIS
ncbi:iojap-like ribosome-associated protein [Bartonella tamiae Th307]|nr:iojap-like ribosome-associated protein [Bartonella tamiae Th307]